MKTFLWEDTWDSCPKETNLKVEVDGNFAYIPIHHKGGELGKRGIVPSCTFRIPLRSDLAQSFVIDWQTRLAEFDKKLAAVLAESDPAAVEYLRSQRKIYYLSLQKGDYREYDGRDSRDYKEIASKVWDLAKQLRGCYYLHPSRCPLTLESPVSLGSTKNGGALLIPFNGKEDGYSLLVSDHERMLLRIPPQGQGVDVVARGNREHVYPNCTYVWQEIALILSPGSQIGIKPKQKAKFNPQWRALHWDGENFVVDVPERFQPPSDKSLDGAEEL